MTTEFIPNFEYHLTPKRDFSGMMKTFALLINEGKLKGTADLKSILFLTLYRKGHK